MNITQQEMDAILNPRVRRRTLSIPVRKGSLGELRRPPKVGGVHRLRVPVPQAAYRARAELQPSRARAVLDFIARCERRPKDIVVTVQSKPVREIRDGVEVWTFIFEKGDHASAQDRPVFLAKVGDYTLTQSRQAVPGDPEVLTPLASDLAKARAKALERRVGPQQQAIARMHAELDTLALAMRSMKARERIKRLRKELDKLAEQSSVDNGDTLTESERAECSSPVAVQDERPPSGTESVVSLEPAA